MLDPRIPFKNRWLAGVLAFLLPGAGHAYQGRWFKAISCFVCILGTFVYGMFLGDWGVVYWKPDPTNFLNPFYAQVFVGLPALPALVQSRRYQSPDNVDTARIEGQLNAPFTGIVRMDAPSTGIPNGELAGSISLTPDRESPLGGVRGEFDGTLTVPGGQPVKSTLRLGREFRMAKPVNADPDRRIDVDVVNEDNRPMGRVSGSTPRSFWNRFEAPPEEDYFLELHRDLGKFHELALTFTMIAGLLNILVILDAVEGPAYGYGDDDESPDRPAKKDDPPAGPPQKKRAAPGAGDPKDPGQKAPAP